MKKKAPLVTLWLVVILSVSVTAASTSPLEADSQTRLIECNENTQLSTSLSPLEPANESWQYLRSLINATGLVDFLAASQGPTGGFHSLDASEEVMSTGNALSTLDLINATDLVDEVMAENYLFGLQRGDGGFAFNDTTPYSDPDSTFFGILGLEAMNALGIVDPVMVSTYFLTLQEPSGGFKYYLNASDADIQSTFDATLSMQMLNTLHMINATEVANYVLTLQRFDGSFAFNTTQDTGTIDATFFAIMTLKTLGKLGVFNMNNTVAYLVTHWDGATGGFSPTAGGIPTIVATYEAVLPLDVLGRGTGYPYQLTRNFLVDSQNDDGGFPWFPAGNSDPWGCHFAVFALAHLPRIANIAVSKVTLSKTVVGQGYPLSINVTAENQGDSPETFNVTACYHPSALSEGFESGTFADWSFHYSTNGQQSGSVPAGFWESTIVSDPSAISGSYSAKLLADSYVSTTPWRVDAAINQTITRGDAQILRAKLKFDSITDPGSAPGHAFFHISLVNAQNASEAISYGFDNSSSLMPGDITYDVSPGDLVDFEANVTADYFTKHGKALPEELIIRFMASADYAEPAPGRQTVEVRLDNIAFVASPISIETKNVTLAGGNSSVITLQWNTTTIAKGYYTISADVDPLSYETDFIDNTYIDGSIFVTIAGDVDGDRDVDIYDIVRMAGVYGVSLPDPRYDPVSDMDGDSDIDIYDIVIAAGNYGRRW